MKNIPDVCRTSNIQIKIDFGHERDIFVFLMQQKLLKVCLLSTGS